MRVFWSPRRLALLAFLGAVLSLGAPLGWAQTGDTTRTAERVTISREGIRIDNGAGIQIKNGVQVVDGTVQVDGEKHRVTIDLDGEGRRGRGEIVSFFRDVHVPPGKVVHGEVVSLFGNAKIEGEVIGDAVAVFGSLQLGDSARIGGDAVALGGIDAAPGAVVQGDMVSIPFFGFHGFSSWTIAIALLLLTGFCILCTWLAAIVVPERLVRVAETVSQRTLMSFFLGILSGPMVLVLGFLLCVTMIGIPVAVLLGALYPVFVFVGFVATATLMGSRLRNASLDAKPVWISALIGVTFNGAFIVTGGILLALSDTAGALHAVGMGLCAVGFLLQTLLSVLGSGALILSGLGAKRAAPPAETVSMGQVPQTSAPA